ncbi:Proteasome subunit alpha beta [Echinococcus multilocularis]|uniref:Proteasome subunit alpha type n=1 Tax=Echinococcus multilocularis TaxID=6211 RepID=A0A087W0U1_ECHMU|nr:Proteasome subunit alpha beta [Echinococcus multilocularis]
MSSIGTGYDLSASQFSPEGKVFQIEYAYKAVENSGTAVALKGKDGVVFAVENIVLSKLYEPGCVKRTFSIDEHIGMVVAGLQSDTKALVEVARNECTSYRENFGSPIPVKSLCERISMHMHAYTLYSAIRPFGVSILLGSYEKDGPHLYVIEPSGMYYAYEGCAIGKARQNAKTELEQIKLGDMNIQQLIKEAAKVIYTVHDEIKDKNFELDLSWVGAKTDSRHQVVPSEVHQEAEDYAKRSLEESGDLDEEIGML